jgi:guanylate kinase
VDYHFLDPAAFRALLAEDALLEHAEYVGDLYGTPSAPVDEALRSGCDVLLEIELDGARQVKAKRSEAVMLFIAPPSLAELERRLRGRGTDGEAKIQRRLARARDELRAVREFDYLLVNDRLDDAVRGFKAVVRAERLRAARLTDAAMAALQRTT